MNRYTLYEEYRLIERNESEINVAWSGAHLLLFFLAFVFGSFCTFCFHMLMYLFDEKCVLFPKLLSLTSLRHNVIYEFIPNSKDQDHLPVDFLSTQWVEKSTCDLPTYVPLVSGIFGLVWTTMFLMCSTGGRTSGFHRPWRVLLPVCLFSLTMGILCIYSSTITHYGLQELCNKLGEITGSSGGCSYTVNAATLAYERSIRGVYQATRLTIITAWLHTGCWILSAILALVRVFMVIDFQLVKINVSLRGDIDKMLQQHEQHIRTVSPDPDSGNRDERGSMFHVRNNAKVRFRPKRKRKMSRQSRNKSGLEKKSFDILFFSRNKPDASEYSLYSPPKAKTKAKKRTKKENIFIRSSTTLLKTIKTILKRHRQDKLTKDAATSSTLLESESSKDGLNAELSRRLYGLLDRHINKRYNRSSSTSLESTYSSDMSEERHLIDKVMARRKFRPRLDLEIKEVTAQISAIKPVDAQIELKDNIDKVSDSSISLNTEPLIESESKQILGVFESEIEKNNSNGNYQQEDNDREDNIEEIINEMVDIALEMNQHTGNITSTDIIKSTEILEVNKDMMSYTQSTMDEIIDEGLKKDDDSDKLNIDSKIDADRIVDEVSNEAEVEHVPPISKQTQTPPKPKQD